MPQGRHKVGNIRKRHGKFQAQVRREGVTPVYKTFTNKKDAVVWVRGIEARIDAGETNVAAPKATSLADLITRYSQEITPLKKGRDTEQRRLNRLLKDPIAITPLSKLTSAKLAEFRDRRINDGVRAAQYDLVLIKHCIKIARLEWGVSMPNNPVDSIRIPNGIRRRERRLRDALARALFARRPRPAPAVRLASRDGAMAPQVFLFFSPSGQSARMPPRDLSEIRISSSLPSPPALFTAPPPPSPAAPESADVVGHAAAALLLAACSSPRSRGAARSTAISPDGASTRPR